MLVHVYRNLDASTSESIYEFKQNPLLLVLLGDDIPNRINERKSCDPVCAPYKNM